MTASPSPIPVSLITHADALPPGTRLAEFEVRGLLGAGGFGMVYQAFDHSLQRPVAIKEYMPAALASRAADRAVLVRHVADQPAFQAGLQSFVAEARLLAQFDHPSLVKVFRYWEGHQTAYMVMPLYRGITLQAARSQMRTPPTEAWLRKVLWAVLGALKTLHQGQAVHRDVSPDNIFLQDVGPPVLLDLGAARHAIGGNMQEATAMLKLNYAPLEQYAGTPDMRQGPWTDLYALAAVVHGLLCNKPPLPATFRAMRDRLPPIARVARTVQEQFGLTYSPAFVKAIGLALAIAPQDRPQSVQALVQAMALETPNGMSRFDWRAELGPICVPPGPSGQPLPVAAVPSRPAGAPVRGGMPTPPWAPPAPRREAAVVKAHDPAPTPGRFSLPWRAGAGVVMLAAGVLSAALFMGWGDKATGDGQVAPTPAFLVTAAMVRPATPGPLAAVPVSAPPGGPHPLVIQAPLPAAAGSVSAAGRVTPKKAAAQTKAANQSPQPAVGPLTVVAAPEPVEAPTAPRAASADPRQLCADSNFVTRPMCIFRQCQKPELAGLAMCIENNARLQNNQHFERF